MEKFVKIKNTEIRKMYECRTTGEVVRTVCIIGQVSELLQKEIIFNDNVSGNETKWLCIAKCGDEIIEFSSLQEAKDFALKNYPDLGW